MSERLYKLLNVPLESNQLIWRHHHWLQKLRHMFGIYGLFTTGKNLIEPHCCDMEPVLFMVFMRFPLKAFPISVAFIAIKQGARVLRRFSRHPEIFSDEFNIIRNFMQYNNALFIYFQQILKHRNRFPL